MFAYYIMEAPRRGRPIKYLTPEEKENAAKLAKSRAAKKYYEKKSDAYCERQRQYYEHREEILQKVKDNRCRQHLGGRGRCN